MTDKEFDKLIKDALTSYNVPGHLNDSLMFALRKKEQQRAKILKFVKACSSCAAVFICAVAVISYYNSNDTIDRTKALPQVKNTVEEKAEEENIQEKVSPKTNETAENENIALSKAPHKKSVAPKKVPAEKADTAMPAAEASEAIADAAIPQGAAITPDAAVEESAPAPMMRKIAQPTLGELFNEGYDYKTAISDRISARIALMDFPEKINFSQITGDESFSLSEENVLTIEFHAGTIASEEHGDLFFTVGTVQNGVLE